MPRDLSKVPLPCDLRSAVLSLEFSVNQNEREDEEEHMLGLLKEPEPTQISALMDRGFTLGIHRDFS